MLKKIMNAQSYINTLLFLFMLFNRYNTRMEIVRTTDSPDEPNDGDNNCELTFLHEKYETVSELKTLNASNCELVSLKNIICTMCSETPDTLVNMSWNGIRMLDEVECNCPGITEIDFSNNGLSVLRANSFIFVLYVRRIYIAGNHIHSLDERVFSGLTMLQLLDLSRNALRRIQLDVFNGLSNLLKLNLSENEIQHVVSSRFTGLKILKELDLSHNNIHSLDARSFEAMQNLRFLDLSENKLWNSKLDFLSEFLNLSIVNLSGNNFTSFEYDSLNGFHIHEIILSDLMELRYILAGSFRDSNCFKRLDLSRNKKLIFMEDFTLQNVPKFTKIDVSDTNLFVLPVESKGVDINAERTPLKCECIDTQSICLNNSSLKGGNLTQICVPMIVSQIEDSYSLFVGQSLTLDCFAVGFPKPHLTWEKVYFLSNGTIGITEVLADGYFLNLHILSLNMEGRYRCKAESNGTKIHKYFSIDVKRIDVTLTVISRSTHSILVGWNKPLQKQRYVLMYRAFETSSEYAIQKLNEYWKVFILRSLHPFTEYEICIASFSDTNDKSCVRTMTGRKERSNVGIRHNNLAIAFLVISAIIFGAFVLTTVYKCVHKVRIITRQNVFIVGSESRECFADVTESTFTYENQHTELLIDKTEL